MIPNNPSKTPPAASQLRNSKTQKIDYSASTPASGSSARDPLEVLAEQYAHDVQAGKDSSLDRYIRRMPEREQEIRQLFPAVLLMEKMKECGPGQRIKSGSAPSIAQPKLTGKKLGEFVLLRQIGRGGMGVVYQAVQQGLDRRVALKVMNQGSITTQTQLKRFRREVRLAANLHHNHIVPVFSVGEDQGFITTRCNTSTESPWTSWTKISIPTSPAIPESLRIPMNLSPTPKPLLRPVQKSILPHTSRPKQNSTKQRKHEPAWERNCQQQQARKSRKPERSGYSKFHSPSKVSFDEN